MSTTTDSDSATAPATPPKGRRKWLIPTLTGVAGLVIGAAAAGSGGSSAPAATSAVPGTGDTSTVTVTAGSAIPPPPVTTTVTAKAAAPTATQTVKATPTPETAFGEGVYLVGEDIKPGRYRTKQRVDGLDCYWVIYSSPNNTEDIVDNDNPAGGRPTVNLRKGQQFSSERCGDWVHA